MFALRSSLVNASHVPKSLVAESILRRDRSGNSALDFLLKLNKPKGVDLLLRLTLEVSPCHATLNPFTLCFRTYTLTRIMFALAACPARAALLLARLA